MCWVAVVWGLVVIVIITAANPTCPLCTANSSGEVVTVYKASCDAIRRADPVRFGSESTRACVRTAGGAAGVYRSSCRDFAIYLDGGEAAVQVCQSLVIAGAAHY